MQTLASRTIALGVVLAFVVAACGGGNVFDLSVGTCFDDGDATQTEVSDVPIVDCADSHDNEVYYLFDLPDGSFPGEDVVDNAAFDGCLAAFEQYVGRDYQSSDLGLTYLTPTRGSWDQDDREVVCVLYDFELGRLDGSMKGSGV